MTFFVCKCLEIIDNFSVRERQLSWGAVRNIKLFSFYLKINYKKDVSLLKTSNWVKLLETFIALFCMWN